MTGRGRGFSIIPKKEEPEDDDKQSEVSSNITFIGRGRGLITLPPSQQQRSTDSPTDDSSSVSAFPLAGRGRGMMGLLKPPPKVSDESPSDEGASSISSFPFIGRGRGNLLSANRTQQQLPSTSTKSSDQEKQTQNQFEDVASPKKSGSSGRGRGSTSGLGSDERRESVNIPVVPVQVQQVTSQMQSIRIEPQGQPGQSSTAADAAESTFVEETDQPEPVLKHGKGGQAYRGLTNCIMLESNKKTGIYEYDIRFTPEVDSKSLRRKFMSQLRNVIGETRNYDGDNVLYLPIEINSSVETAAVDGQEVSVKITFRRKQRMGECIRFYNILFERVMTILNYQRVGRKCFDPTAPKIIPQHKLEVWPGYVKSVEEQEGGLMLLLDVSHRVLSQKTVLEYFTQILQSRRDNWKDLARKALIGSVVLTRYNNRSYRIDEIIFDQKPTGTFMRGEVEVRYVDYYKNEYNIKIQDLNQPLLMSRKEVRIAGELQKREVVSLLVPELCYMTGLTDDLRSNFTVMKDLATYTKLSPYQRVAAYKKFVENVNGSEKAKTLLTSWGLKLDSDPVKVTARLLDEEVVVFGRDKQCKVGPNADFGRNATSNEILEPMDIGNWILMFTKNDKNTADGFANLILKVSGPTGIRCAPPRLIELQNDRTETYINEIRSQLNDKKIQMIVTIFPTLRDDRYSAVKKVLCAEVPCPSQCINSKTLRNENKNRSIVQKILLQMNAKLGGALWGIKIPLKNTMIIGIDTYHEAGHKGLTVGGFVASFNATFTKWFSRPAIQQKREELINGLLVSMNAALNYYREINGCIPDRIIVYRDGVGDGQLSFVQSYEIPQIEEACRKFESNYSPKITLVVVQKRINHKFFKILNDKGTPDSLANPPPGSVLDNTITRRYMYDFFLCAQHVREGTLTPSHYIVLKDDNDFEPDILQRLTYKLSYLYYNWPGSVRVPAPCQYAHKLAFLVGMAIKKQTADTLNNKLFYL